MTKIYNLFDIYWDENDIQSVTSVIKRGSYWAVGPEILEFEKKIASYYNIKFAITFNSGTSALHALLLAHGITSGEVIVPSFSFISTVNAVVLAGATPIFADIEEETFGLDVNDVLKKITPNTKAILPMHYGGKICKDILTLRKIADEKNLILIEDNAEGFGAKFQNQFAGTFGHSAILSFCQNKVLTTGEGGAVITNDEDVFHKLNLIRSHGRVENDKVDYFHNIEVEDYIAIGYNYRMPTICAALGISQLQKIEQIIQKRRNIGKYYDDHLLSDKNIKIPSEYPKSRNVYQLYSIMINNPKQRSSFQKYLLENGIYTKIYFAPIHFKSYYREKYKLPIGFLPKTEEISDKIVSIPFSPNFVPADQDFIIQTIKNFFQR